MHARQAQRFGGGYALAEDWVNHPEPDGRAVPCSNHTPALKQVILANSRMSWASLSCPIRVGVVRGDRPAPSIQRGSGKEDACNCGQNIANGVGGTFAARTLALSKHRTG
jgi:hypothetical protein